MLSFALALATLSGPIRVVDGDTIRAGSERIRLLGIDAPDNPGNGRCRPFPKPGSICDLDRSQASKGSLIAAITPRMQIDRVGQDRYGRTLAVVWSSNANLSCWQLRRRQAVYHPEWDNGRRIAKACPDAGR
jgi:endonuclease YncB( thermonuclease family)